MSNNNYRAFLESGFWKNLSIKKKFSVGNKCEYCRSTENLNCHHKVYNKNWYKTSMDDLIVLCFKCHKSTHKAISIYGSEPFLNKKQINTLKKDTISISNNNKISPLELSKLRLSALLELNKVCTKNIKKKNNLLNRINFLKNEISKSDSIKIKE
jgi:hypothetical protein